MYANVLSLLYKQNDKTMRTQINKTNFMNGTVANFTGVEMPTTTPDYVSESGSKYWYTENGVIRAADHWGLGIATCDWSIDIEFAEKFQKEVTKGDVTYMGTFYKAKEVAGFCAFEDFTQKQRQFNSNGKLIYK